MTVELRPASGLSLPQLAELFNAGYAGYVTPVNLSEAQMGTHIERQDVALEQSPVAWNGAQPVGLALLARRERRGWVAGIGVIAARRRQGLGRRLMSALLENARTAGLEAVQLEVIVGNEAAHQLYLSMGFHDMRELLIITRAPAPHTVTSWPGQMEPGTLAQALAAYDRLHASANPWQRQPEALLRAQPEPSVWLAVQDGEVVAYAVGAFSDERLAFQDVGASERHPDAFAALLSRLHSAHPQAHGSFVNLSEHDPTWPAFEALGYRATMRQHEMCLNL